MSNTELVLQHDLGMAIPALIDRILKEEQADLPVIHRFGPGIYVREAYMKAGTIVVGYKHKQPHMNVMLQGKLILLNEDGTTKEMVAPMCFTAPAGRKTAYIVEDVVWQNIYATEETDVSKLEAEFLELDEVALPTLPLDDILLLDYVGDNHDFVNAVAEFGLTVDQVDEMVEDMSDHIPFPEGNYKIVVADSLIHGKGMFATFPIEEGEVIAPARLGGKRTPAGRLVNHSRHPNAKAVRMENGDMYIVATQKLQGSKGAYLGDEITLDYRQVLETNGLRRVECQQP